MAGENWKSQKLSASWGKLYFIYSISAILANFQTSGSRLKWTNFDLPNFLFCPGVYIPYI